MKVSRGQRMLSKLCRIQLASALLQTNHENHANHENHGSKNDLPPKILIMIHIYSSRFSCQKRNSELDLGVKTPVNQNKPLSDESPFFTQIQPP